MSETRVIQALFQRSIDLASDSSSLDQEMLKFIHQKEISIDELVRDCFWQETMLSPEKTIENWKRLLTLNLLNHYSKPNSTQLVPLLHSFERQPWNQSSQFFRLMAALNHHLAEIPVPEVGVHLLESGAALIDFQEYCPWLSLPYHPYHLEFGIFLCALALLSKRSDLEPYVRRLASWQLNMLDVKGYPFNALFIREKDNNYFELILLHYLLFRGAACLTKDNKFAYFSELLGKHVKEIFEIKRPQINPLWVLIEKVFEWQDTTLPVYDLPSQIHDSSTSLIGYRTEQQSAVCTLHGGHTGLGYLRDQDVEIINYGPQYFPLDDCGGFGIEGNHLSDHGIRQSIMEWTRHGFSLKGCVRMVDQQSTSPMQLGLFRGIWLEVGQEYKHSQMRIKTSFLGLDGWDSVAFCFFVKAQKCQINQTCLLPGKLEHYEGDIIPIRLEGKQSALDLSALVHKGRMQVIPLCGGSNFWGANFLVAYLLDSNHRNYTWSIDSVKTTR